MLINCLSYADKFGKFSDARRVLQFLNWDLFAFSHARKIWSDSRDQTLLAFGFVKRSHSREVMHSPFSWRRNPTKNTWFSATFVFSLVFHWFSAVFPTLCTVVSKKTKRSCFGGFFSLVFEIQATAWFSWVVCMLKQGTNRNITFYINIIKIEYSKEAIQACQWDVVFANKQLMSTHLLLHT